MNQTIKGLAKRFGFGSKEQKAYTLTDPLAAWIFGIVPTASGANVTDASALRVPAVSQAVRLISENCGSTPVKVYEDADAGKAVAKDHPAYRLVHRAANEWTSAVEFRTQLTLDAIMHGNAFAECIRLSDGSPFYLRRLEPRRVAILEDARTGAPVYRVNDPDRGVVGDYNHREILHLSSFGGVSPITVGQEAIGLAMILEREMARYFGSGAMPKAVVTRENVTPLSGDADNTVANFISSWTSTVTEGRNATPVFLPPKWDLKPLSLSSTDSQFLEHRIEQVNEIARLFGVPPHLLYNLERATLNNAEEMSQTFRDMCLRFWFDRWQSAYDKVLFSEDERDNFYTEFVIDDLQRANSAARADIFSKLIAATVMVPNEARATMNLPPLPGGDVAVNPYTTSTTNSAPPAANDDQPAQDQAA